MRSVLSTILLTAAVTLALGCDTKPGPDSITSHTGGSSGGTVTSCTTICHTPGGTIGPDPFTSGGSGTAGKHVAHVTTGGQSCDRCHYGYATNPNHFNGVINAAGIGPSPVIFDPLNSLPSSSGTFTYVAGPPAEGNCSNLRCHVDGAGTSTTMNWYGPDVPFILPNCSVCHSVPIGVRRQALGAAGDFFSNPTVTSHHVVQAADPNTGQCKVCHDQYQHMAGTVQLRQAAIGTRVTYSSATPSTLEPFCLGCHNISGATFTFAAGGSPLNPFNDTATLGTAPYIASRNVASSWNGSSIHRSRGLTCAGTGAPNTGCHGRPVSATSGTINMHGSTVKGLLNNAMNFQIPVDSQSTYTVTPTVISSWNYANYKLCFDCHESSPAVTKDVVLGYKKGGVYDLTKAPSPYSTTTTTMRSMFRERYIINPANYPIAWGGVDQPYNDTIFNDAYLALHNFHLIGFRANPLASDPTANMLQWKYRGNAAVVGRIQCTACHDVHGTPAPTIRSTHPELGLQKDFPLFLGFTPMPGESYTSLDPLISPAIMTSYPMNCAIDCHGVKGQSSYWHTPLPAGE
jgi:predicted CxxxxCH...CXXCH cytochrome family protein